MLCGAMSGEDDVRALQEALSFSPDNVPLRRHLASTLRALGRAEEAAKELRKCLARAPQDVDARLMLAACYLEQGKTSEAEVVAESLVKGDEPPAAALVLLARIQLAAGEAGEAARAYRRAVELDPAARDAGLDERFGGRARGGARYEADEDGDEDEDEDELELEEPLRLVVGDAEDDADAGLEVERPKQSFDDVGGMDELKEQIALKIIQPMKNPELFRAYGKKVGGGILMYGPPGCGKTYLARATAGEVDAHFIAVGISDVLDMYVGQSEQKLARIFAQARSHAPCVLFFDEVDALGASRSDMRHSAVRPVINTFLAELDGVQGANDGVLVLGATNAPWHLDSAFRRPGRFDRIVFVPPPDEPARAAILALQCKQKPLRDVDFAKLARKTNGFSGADLMAVVDVAVEDKLRAAMRTGTPEPLTTKDLLAAAKRVRPSTKDWFGTARNYALYANESGLYDDVLAWLDDR